MKKLSNYTVFVFIVLVIFISNNDALSENNNLQSNLLFLEEANYRAVSYSYIKFIENKKFFLVINQTSLEGTIETVGLSEEQSKSLKKILEKNKIAEMYIDKEDKPKNEHLWGIELKGCRIRQDGHCEVDLIGSRSVLEGFKTTLLVRSDKNEVEILSFTVS